MTTTDTKFFTNDTGLTLLDRFKSTIKDSRFFDVLVGYFRISGFHQLYDSFEKVEKTRILVGLNVDQTTSSTTFQRTQQSGKIGGCVFENLQAMPLLQNEKII